MLLVFYYEAQYKYFSYSYSYSIVSCEHFMNDIA